MRKYKLFIVLILLLFVASWGYSEDVFLIVRDEKGSTFNASPGQNNTRCEFPEGHTQGEQPLVPFLRGEKISYDIRKFGIKAGEASLVFNGYVQINGMDAFKITFTAKAFNFFDEEKIYLDPKTFYPIIVERNLNIWGKKEHIIERYDAEKGIVNIVKDAGGKVYAKTIKKGRRIDNIYCFIYRYRNSGIFKPDEVLEILLPTKDVEFRLVKNTTFKMGDKEFNAYYLQSELKEYRIWFGRGPNKLPLRIDGAVGFGKASMIMKTYSAQ